jgi:hypothetical protein
MYDIKQSLSYDIEQPHPPLTPPNALPPTEHPASESNTTTPSKPSKPTQSSKTTTSPTLPPTPPPTPTEETPAEPPCFPDLHAPFTQAQGQPNSHAPGSALTPPPTTSSYPPASRPRYQNQTLTSALRATPKSPKARTRKRSVTFAVSESGGEGIRERGLVVEGVGEVEKRLCNADGEGGEVVRMESSVASGASEEGDLAHKGENYGEAKSVASEGGES